MPHRPLDRQGMHAALEALDRGLDRQAHLVIGGGAAMVLAYRHPLATQDVDAFAAKGSVPLAALEPLVKRIAKAEGIEPDWLNAHFVTFTHVLPRDYAARLRKVYEGTHLRVDALGPEDMLVMKCFAGRDKDRPHALKLLQLRGLDLDLIDRHLAELEEKRIPGAARAADYFDDLRDVAGV